jgi:hypothetical protein
MSTPDLPPHVAEGFASAADAELAALLRDHIIDTMVADLELDYARTQDGAVGMVFHAPEGRSVYITISLE